jgi:ribosome-associated translation inhibitor RaiA
MQTQVTFHGLDPSPALRTLIEARMAMLERRHDRITSCRVTIELPHHRHAKGNHWQVKVAIAVPGDEIVITRSSESGDRDNDPAAAVRDAFVAARRRLQDHARRVDGRTKHHDERLVAQVLAIAADHGFLETDDGHENKYG